MDGAIRHDISKKTLPMIYQAENSECSLACLAMVCCYHGLKTDLVSLREKYPISLRGATLFDVVDLAKYAHLNSRPVRVEIPSLKKLALPALLHWNLEHFVVLKEIRRGKFIIHDPAVGIQSLSEKTLSNHFTGIAVEFTPTQDFQIGKLGEHLTLSRLFGITKNLGTFVLQITWLTAALELLALLSPVFLKLTIDTGLANNDFEFITALTLGLVGVAFLQGLMTYLRNYLILYFGAKFNQQFVSNLFRHLLRLPMSFFINRMTGDLIDRYQSTNIIRNMFSRQLPQVFLDGMVAIVSLLVIFFISKILFLIALGSFFIYLIVRLAFYRPLRTLSEKMVQAHAEENSHVIDTLRGMQPIKVFAKESERHQIWENYYAHLVNADMKLGLFQSFLGSCKLFILGIDMALSIYFGSHLVASNTISLGLLFAFFAYKAYFIQRASVLAEHLIDFRLIGIHLDRLSDIVFNLPEQDVSPKREIHAEAPFNLELRNVCFKYSPLEPYVLKGVNLSFDTNDFIAIVGPSGSGKTTLFKIILGLLRPEEGEVLFNGQPLDEWDMTQYRRLFGVVMQEDQLLAGTIVDNIAFFEACPDEDRVQECAKTALIWDEIDVLPMKLNSRIGDLGSALSGGQKQRILLARALYYQPKIMLMDEGTANLDEDIERKLLDNITALGVTCISIAHRPETIRRASRIFQLQDGNIAEQTQNTAPTSV